MERSSHICKTCRDDRLSHGHPPRYLLILPKKARHGKEVLACEHCDGPVVELARRKESK